MPTLDSLSPTTLWSVCIPKTRPSRTIEQPPDETALSRSAPTLRTPAKTDFTGTGATKSTSIGGTGSGSLSWNAGDFVVVLGATGDQSTTIGAPTGPASLNSFQPIAGPVTTTNSCWVMAWAATANASGSGTISATRTGNVDVWGLLAWSVDATTSDGIGNVNAPAASTSIQTAAMPYEASNSAIIEIIADWGAGVGGTGTVPSPRNWTPATGVTEREAVGVSSSYIVYSAEWSNQAGGAPVDYGISVPASAQNYSRLVVEILGKSVASGDATISASENITGTDNITQFERPLSETITGADNVSQLDRPLDESIGITDSVTVIERTVTESITVTDSATLDTGGVQKSDSETVTVTDAVTKIEKTVTETISITESITQFDRPATETVAITDVVAIDRTVTENVSITDITSDFARTGISEPITITDSVNTFARPVSEAISAADSATLTISTTVTEIIAITDTVSTFTRPVSDTVTITENASTGTPISVTETVTGSDSVSTIARILPETVTISDTATIIVTISVSETIAITDSATLTATQTTSETITITDNGTKSEVPLLTWGLLTGSTQTTVFEASTQTTFLEG